MESSGEPWELLLVDDGSTDGSTEKIRELAETDEHVRPVIFARNFGHQIAVTAGLDYARGDAVVVIDSDLQDPPEIILDMVAKWQEGFEVVYAVRAEREGESWFKLWTASLFYRIIYRITDVKIPLDTGDFRLMDRKVVDVMNSMRERHRFLRGMSAWVGFKQSRCGIQAGCTPGRYNQVSVPQDAAPGVERCYRFFIFSVAGCDLHRFLRGKYRYFGHPSGCFHAYYRFAGILRPGNHPDRGALPGRCAVDFAGYSRRIYWTSV